MTAAIDRFRGRMIGAGVIGIAACAAGFVVSPDQFHRSWLFAWIFWIGVGLGCLPLLMIQHITGGKWGVVARRLMEAGSRTVPFMAILFLPILAGLTSLYPWARPEVVAASDLLQHKAAYLNVPGFVGRAVVFFALWSGLAWLLSRWSKRQDETGDERLPRRFQMLSAGGLIVYVLTMTLASVDWVMSLEPEWFSTIFGALLMAGQAVSAFCVVIASAIVLSSAKPLSDAVTVNRLHELAKLLFAFVLVWAYFALSQFLIIWSGNLPEEIPWYLKRLQGGWEWVGLSLILLHFALPFALLLMRSVKRNARRLLGVCALVFFMRIVDLYWIVMPAPGATRAGIHWLDLAAWVGIGGVWLYLYAREIGRMPLLPQRDPYFQEAMTDGHD